VNTVEQCGISGDGLEKQLKNADITMSGFLADMKKKLTSKGYCEDDVVKKLLETLRKESKRVDESVVSKSVTELSAVETVRPQAIPLEVNLQSSSLRTKNALKRAVKLEAIYEKLLKERNEKAEGTSSKLKATAKDHGIQQDELPVHWIDQASVGESTDAANVRDDEECLWRLLNSARDYNDSLENQCTAAERETRSLMLLLDEHRAPSTDDAVVESKVSLVHENEFSDFDYYDADNGEVDNF